MANSSYLFQEHTVLTMLKALVCLTLLKVCASKISYYSFDLSSVSLDPLTTGFTITGNAGYDWLGESVSTAGDINNDGYNDIIVGGNWKSSGKGVAYVIYGGEKSSMRNIDLATTALDPLTTGFTITGSANNDHFGVSVCTAGDVNQDGYSDIMIGANGKSGAKGAVYVIYGGEKSSMRNIDLATTTLDPLKTGFMITGNAAGDNFGWSVSRAGDINKDGYSDIIIGAYYKDTQRGAVYVIYGREKSSLSNIDLATTTLDPLKTGFMITGNAINDRLGGSVSTAGDINKDGYSDIIIGAYNKDSQKGTVYVIYGREKSSMSNIDLTTTTLDPLTTGFMVTGNAASDQFGYSVSTAGDLNQDGYNDIIVGASYKGSLKGAAYVIYGGNKLSMRNLDLMTTPLDPLTTGFMITGNAAGDLFGISVSAAGDINKDGYGDIIIGASRKNNFQGAAYVVYGGKKSSMRNIDLATTTLDPLKTGFMITGNGGSFGWSVNTAGDINKDGNSDIIIGAYSNNAYKGALYVIHTVCSPCWNCSNNCNQCSSSPSSCDDCLNPFFLHKSQCVALCPATTFGSINICKECSSHCSSCISQESCQSCEQGYTLSNSLCVSPSPSQITQGKAYQSISSGAKGVGSVVCVGSATFPLVALVSKIVQNTRYLNLSVTDELAEIYQTWDTDFISWQPPNAFSSQDHFKPSPFLFAQYGLSSPFLTNFWPNIMTIGISFMIFITCLAIQTLLERAKYKGWAYFFIQKFVAGSFNFALVQAYGCLDEIFFDLVLDAKTNPFNTFFSWASLICATLFVALGCLLVYSNFWIVSKYQTIKHQGIGKETTKDLEAFNERNKYWELFYSDFNDENLWTQSFFAILVIRSSLSSLITTVLYYYPLTQTTCLLILDGAIILSLFKKPFSTLRGQLSQIYFETITLLVHTCTFILSLQQNQDEPSDTLKLIMSTGIIYLNTALVTGAIGFMFIEVYETIRHQIKVYRMKQHQNSPPQLVSEESQILASRPLETTQRLHSETDAQNKQDWANNEQTTSVENLHLLSGNRQNSSIFVPTLRRVKPSQVSDPSFHLDHSLASDFNTSHIINRRKGKSIAPILFQNQPPLNE